MASKEISELKVSHFVEARALELVNLAQSLKAVKGGKRVFQTLPRHMRRRAMSHHSKRVPRALRELHKKEIEKAGKLVPNKRPSRKFRRRPSNLLKEYTRRQNKNIWLETHIWHAKRFKMVELWGYKLPSHPCDKSIRACYRATSKFALLHDMSYYNCIELVGSQEELLKGLNTLTDPSCGLGFGAKSFIDGKRQGTVVIYHNSQFPYGAIGPVSFLWKSTTSTEIETLLRHLWLWVHPSCHTEVLEELSSIFNLVQVPSSSVNMKKLTEMHRLRISEKRKNSHKTKKRKRSKDKKPSEVDDNDNYCPPLKKFASSEVLINDDVGNLETKTSDNSSKINFERIATYVGSTVTMILLKDTLVRFRIVGPLAHSLLSRTLKYSKHISDMQISSNGTELEKDSSTSLPWWKHYYSNTETLEIAQQQKIVWDHLAETSSPSDLASNTVLGINVRDPRLLLPPKKTLVLPSSKVPQNSRISQSISTNISVSSLWDADIRDELIATKMPQSALNNLRSKQLVPGAELNLGDKESVIPLLLIYNPGNRDAEQSSFGYGEGWDVIIPPGWAMPFLVAFVYNGARVGGLRELQSIAYEERSLTFPYHYPDTNGNKVLQQSEENQLKDKYFRHPPAKRLNYTKLGFVSPFAYPWQKLVSEWIQFGNEDSLKDFNEEKFYVLRSLKQIKWLRSVCVEKKLRVTQTREKSSGILDFNHSEPCLVGVHLNFICKGSIGDHAMVCLPTEEDLDILKSSKSGIGPIEPEHHDPNQKRRKELRKTLEKFRKQRKKLSKKLAEKNDDELKERREACSGAQETLELQQLWLPKPERIVNSCSRQIIGFVIQGGYSFTSGSGLCFAFCSVTGILKAIEMKDKTSSNNVVILVRDSNSNQYRFAKISNLL